MVLFAPEPDYSDLEPFAKCAACRQLFKLEIVNARIVMSGRACPSCAARIGTEEIEKSFETYVKMRRGIRAAREIIGGDWRLIFIFAIGLLAIFVGYVFQGKDLFFAHSVFIMSSLLLLFGYLKTQKWLDTYGYFLIDEEEFMVAKAEMKRSRLMWVTATILSLCLWFVYFKFL